MSRRADRVAVIGLDCATPRFLFGPEALPMPNVQALAASGGWTTLRSCDPPITVPAWACMTTGCDPGVLGCYGFRNRPDYSYAPLVTANASDIKQPRIWDLLGEAGLQSACVGIPQTYPPSPMNGCLVSGVLTPKGSDRSTYPRSLRAELGDVLFDVDDYRTEDKSGLFDRLIAFMHNRFDVAEFVVRTKPWDFFMMVEMGLDRLHHAFWKFCDPNHPKHVPGNAFQDAFARYYAALDERIGGLLHHVPNDAAVIVVSDHGARALEGGVRVNQWLIDEGYLRVTDDLLETQRLEDCTVDWNNTTAWATGGYVARIYLNIKGREPKGTLPPDERESFLDILTMRLESLEGPDGQPLGNRVVRPDRAYAQCNGAAPDLMVYFGDLRFRSIGTVGHDYIFTDENDTGPDDANHDYEGVFVANARVTGPEATLNPMNMLDIAPTVLDLFGLATPDTMRGAPLRPGVPA